MLASAIMTTVRRSLRDPLPGIHWLDSDLLRFLSNAQRNAVVLRPELVTVRAAIPMVPGTLQAIPSAGTALMRLDENVASKRRVHLVDSAMLDAALLAWPGAAPTVDVDEYTTDKVDRKRFQVYPPNTGAGSVVALYGITPQTLTLGTDSIVLDDEFEPALREFMLAEAFGFATHRMDLDRAELHRRRAADLLGVNAKAEDLHKPKFGATPGGA